MIDRRLFLAGAAGSAIAPAIEAQTAPPLGVFELRQYTLKGGTRAAFTSLFVREFVTTQNVVGCHVRAVFRDLDDPDRFVWMRGFSDMDARKAALEAFYFGPVWKAHREAANAMIVDSDNVLLLRPLTGAVGPKTLGGKGVVRVTIHRLRDVDPAAFTAFFAARIQPAVEAAGARIVATLATEPATNTFPRLPVREHDPVFLWIAHFRDEPAERAFSRKWAMTEGWRDGIADALLPALMQKPEVLRLVPSIPLPDA
jgi:quinol monooxygenase YgiN